MLNVPPLPHIMYLQYFIKGKGNLDYLKRSLKQYQHFTKEKLIKNKEETNAIVELIQSFKKDFIFVETKAKDPEYIKEFNGYIDKINLYNEKNRKLINIFCFEYYPRHILLKNKIEDKFSYMVFNKLIMSKLNNIEKFAHLK